MRAHGSMLGSGASRSDPKMLSRSSNGDFDLIRATLAAKSGSYAQWNHWEKKKAARAKKILKMWQLRRQLQ